MLSIAPIVEGHGEVDAAPILLRRLGDELLGRPIHVLRPIRIKRGRVYQQDYLQKAISLAALKLAGCHGHTSVMVLVDGDGEPGCELGPALTTRCSRDDLDVFCVVACPEFETWFVAAAQSLVDQGLFALASGEKLPEDPEGEASKKGWVVSHFRAGKSRYTETIDQPKLTAKMDLHLCRRQAPSFDKLCRELEKRSKAEG